MAMTMQELEDYIRAKEKDVSGCISYFWFITLVCRILRVFTEKHLRKKEGQARARTGKYEIWC